MISKMSSYNFKNMNVSQNDEWAQVYLINQKENVRNVC
jgi:hypothetical protein